MAGLFLDACPCCGRRDNSPALTAIARSTLVAVYRCADCRHGWWTGWALPALTERNAA